MVDNRQIVSDKLAQRVFAKLLHGLGASRVLDVGANVGDFALDMRELGFRGLIYSVEPQANCRRKMTQVSRRDPRWIVLPSQGAGAGHGVMNLNVTENGHSSSFLAPHANHLRAEPTVRVVGRRLVCVSKTSGLLPEAITASIDALKIDTQGYELQVLKGLDGRFRALKLIMCELSAIPTYEGGPSLAEVEGYITTELGFERVSASPAYVDETTGEIQQFDGIYARRDMAAKARALLEPAAVAGPGAPVEQPDRSGIGLAAVVTSLPGQPLKRPDHSGRDFGTAWLMSCHRSWLSHAPRVISISEAKPVLPGVEWRKVERKPALREIFASLATTPPPGKDAILFTNADINLGPRVGTLLAEMDPHVLYYCSRLDVRVAGGNQRKLEAMGEYFWGYDAFFMPRQAIADIHALDLIPDGLLIGEPFWDYVVPIAALVARHPIKKFFARPHPILHLAHDQISNDHLQKTGRVFLGWLKDLLRRPPSPVSWMLAGFLAAYERTPGSEEQKREAMCRAVITNLM